MRSGPEYLPVLLKNVAEKQRKLYRLSCVGTPGLCSGCVAQEVLNLPRAIYW